MTIAAASAASPGVCASGCLDHDLQIMSFVFLEFLGLYLRLRRWLRFCTSAPKVVICGNDVVAGQVMELEQKRMKLLQEQQKEIQFVCGHN